MMPTVAMHDKCIANIKACRKQMHHISGSESAGAVKPGCRDSVCLCCPAGADTFGMSVCVSVCTAAAASEMQTLSADWTHQLLPPFSGQGGGSWRD